MKPSLIIFLSILAAAIVIAIGFAVLHRYQTRNQVGTIPPAQEPDERQTNYMRDVRRRNQYNLRLLIGYWGRY